MVTAAQDATAIIWTRSGIELRRLEGHAASIEAVAVSSIGPAIRDVEAGRSVVLTGSADGTARLWSADLGTQIRQFDLDAAVTAVGFSRDGALLLVGCADGTVVIRSVKTGDQVRHLTHGAAITAAAFTPDRSSIVTGGVGGVVRLWPLDGTAAIREWAHDGPVTALACSADGQLVAVGSGDGVASCWSIGTAALVRRFGAARERLLALSFSPDSSRLVQAAEDDRLLVLDISRDAPPPGQRERPIAQFGLGSRTASAAVFSADGAFALTGSPDGGSILRSLENGRTLALFDGRSSRATHARFSPDGRWILTGNGGLTDASEHNRAGRWSVEAGREEDSLQGLDYRLTGIEGMESARLYTVGFSPDSRMAVTAGAFCMTRVWDLPTDRWLMQFNDAYGHAAAAISPDGQRLLVGGWGPTAQLVSLPDPAADKPPLGHRPNVLMRFEHDSGPQSTTFTPEGPAPGGILDVAWSPDGLTVATASADHTARLWSPETGIERARFTHEDRVTAVIFSPVDSDTLITASDDGTARVWSVGEALEKRRIAHPGGVRSIAVSPYGRLLASGGADGLIRLHDLATGQLLHEMDEPSGIVWSLDFSPDGRHLLTTDVTTRLWSAETGRELCRLVSLIGGSWVVFTPDGHFDTGNLESVEGVHWVVTDYPMEPLPLEMLMREFYEPRLLTRLLAGENLIAPTGMAWRNRAQPEVRIAAVEPDPSDPSRVSVKVEVSNMARSFEAVKGRIRATSGARDLHLFRDGQLVGFDPLERHEAEKQTDPAPAGTPAAKDGPVSRQTIEFTGIRLPRREGRRHVTFSAYAFNAEGIKSGTASTTIATPRDLEPRKGRAYVMSIGVNRYEDPAWNLQYAVNDAVSVQTVIPPSLAALDAYTDVVPVALHSDDAGMVATKANVRAIIDLLAGRTVEPDRIAAIPGADSVEPAQPEDLVLITYSGHGHTGDDGQFYMMLSDVGERARATPELLATALSSDELTDWLRNVDAGDMALVIDACHSASSVEGEGFKPGPWGSRGLGQMAYNKGMMVLAASQADDVALESNVLQQGVLTFALIREGLEGGEANIHEPKDGRITLPEWFEFGARRVPDLLRDMESGAIGPSREAPRTGTAHPPTGTTGSRDFGDAPRQNELQRPSVFNFRKRPEEVVLRVGGPNDDS